MGWKIDILVMKKYCLGEALEPNSTLNINHNHKEKNMEYFKNCILKHYIDFKGRARRREYWFFALFAAIIIILVGVVGGVLDNILGLSGTLATALVTIVDLGLILPSLSVLVRRLHDIGKSGWWFWISLIPVVGGIILLVFMFLDSQPGSNAYGSNPKGK